MDKNIPVVILCGGMGTRLREETEFKPKPMAEIARQLGIGGTAVAMAIRKEERGKRF